MIIKVPFSDFLYADFLSVVPQIFSEVFSEGLMVIHLEKGEINFKTIVLSWIIMILYQSPVFETPNIFSKLNSHTTLFFFLIGNRMLECQLSVLQYI